jgi:hypothetical protein
LGFYPDLITLLTHNDQEPVDQRFSLIMVKIKFNNHYIKQIFRLNEINCTLVVLGYVDTFLHFLWYHFKRFSEAVKDINPITERFVASKSETGDL